MDNSLTCSLHIGRVPGGGGLCNESKLLAEIYMRL